MESNSNHQKIVVQLLNQKGFVVDFSWTIKQEYSLLWIIFSKVIFYVLKVANNTFVWLFLLHLSFQPMLLITSIQFHYYFNSLRHHYQDYHFLQNFRDLYGFVSLYCQRKLFGVQSYEEFFINPHRPLFDLFKVFEVNF